MQDTHYRPSRSIQLFESGVRVWGEQVCGNPTGKGGGKRGVIVGWSKSSRRELRDFLQTHAGPEGYFACGITLTIPGPVATLAESKSVWEKFRAWFKNQGHCAVWRIELQKRGALHWHLLAFLDIKRAESDYLKRLGCPDALVPDGCKLWSYSDHIMNGWFTAVDSLGACEGDITIKGEIMTLAVEKRSEWNGARQRAVDLKPDNGGGSWLRYLIDHTSKVKQEQIPENIGRHWGVINRKLFKVKAVEKEYRFDGRDYWKFRRSYQRLCTSSHKAPEAPFGRRLGYRPQFGSTGKTDRFSIPEHIEALAVFFNGILIQSNSQ